RLLRRLCVLHGFGGRSVHRLRLGLLLERLLLGLRQQRHLGRRRRRLLRFGGRRVRRGRLHHGHSGLLLRLRGLLRRRGGLVLLGLLGFCFLGLQLLGLLLRRGFLARDLDGLRLLGRLLLGLVGLCLLGFRRGRRIHLLLALRRRDAGRRSGADHDLDRDHL